MQTIPKKSYQYSIDDLATLDEKSGILCSNPEQSEQLKFIQKGVRPIQKITEDSDYVLGLMKNGTNLLAIQPTNRAVEDAQFLYSTQLFNDTLMKSLSSVQVPTPTTTSMPNCGNTTNSRSSNRKSSGALLSRSRLHGTLSGSTARISPRLITTRWRGTPMSPWSRKHSLTISARSNGT